MFNSCICGTSFHHEEDEPCSTSPVSTRIKSKGRSKNPYSSRGLDKFSELLADLDGKRQKIYSQMGSHDVSLVRFMFTNSNDCVPIVIKVRRKGQKSKSCELPKGKHGTPHSGELDKDVKTRAAAQPSVAAKEMESDHKTPAKRNLSWRMRLSKLRRPSYYIPTVLILILLLLAVFGRSAAATFTSLAWYLISLVEDSSESGTSKTTRKDYAREFSEKKMTSHVSFCQKNDHSDGSKQNTLRKLTHQNSW